MRFDTGVPNFHVAPEGLEFLHRLGARNLARGLDLSDPRLRAARIGVELAEQDGQASVGTLDTRMLAVLPASCSVIFASCRSSCR